MEEGIVEAIVSRVWVDTENIYPSVDIGVGNLTEDGSPIVVANVAGFSPRPFALSIGRCEEAFSLSRKGQRGL